MRHAQGHRSGRSSISALRGRGHFRIVAMSDSQMDRDNPDQFLWVIQEGVIPTARER